MFSQPWKETPVCCLTASVSSADTSPSYTVYAWSPTVTRRPTPITFSRVVSASRAFRACVTHVPLSLVERPTHQATEHVLVRLHDLAGFRSDRRIQECPLHHRRPRRRMVPGQRAAELRRLCMWRLCAAHRHRGTSLPA